MDILNNMLWSYYVVWENWHWWLNPYFVGIILEFIIIFIIWAVIKYKPKSSFSVAFDMMYDGIYSFFEDILGSHEKSRIKLYIITMFFVILFSNLLWIVFDIVWVWFPILHHHVAIPTSDINFNVAMAIIWVIILLLEQIKTLWFWKTLYEYFPVLGKNYIPYEKGKMSKYIDVPLFLFVKVFDIIISLFLWVLDIVGHLAKIISLSFRLFGNMTSGSMLMGMLLVWTVALSNIVIWIDFPVLFPILLHVQWLLVAFIQALVFPLLIAIFIKVVKVH